MNEGSRGRMHEATDLRKAYNAVVRFYFEHSHRRPHRLLEQRRSDRDVLELQDFNVSNLQRDSPFRNQVNRFAGDTFTQTAVHSHKWSGGR